MKELSSSQIRQMFLDYFLEKGHDVEPSASLVPHEDPSLLWINSGVATLKKYFDGTITPKNPKIVNAQKSIRTNDIENVGYTARHHTFFEMLGNFSIGDYFKKEAIEYAWEFLTSEEWLGFDEELLSVTVHPEDDEAYDIWLKEIKVPQERIIRLEENFWDIGEGPSGPNTEIFYDRGPSFGNDPNDSELYPGGENARYLEIWNLVFSQFNHNPDDTYTPLPNKNIDTGMGLERVTSIIQNTLTNYETDLFMPIIQATEKLTKIRYGDSETGDSAFKVIADHVRTVTFAIGDGALPSNEGRGYVLRRLLRRAVRFAKELGIEKPFMYKLVDIVGEIMKDFYPEVLGQKDIIKKVIKVEEERFHETLNDGLLILTSILEREKQQNKTVFPGAEVFKLYDTYGFPKELTEEYVEAHGFTIDEAGFEKEMAKQRARAREAREQVNSMQVQDELLRELDVDTTFIGYDELAVQTTVEKIIKDGQIADHISTGETGSLLLTRTPFYAESGGQIADTGQLSNESSELMVEDVFKGPHGEHIHHVAVEAGELHVGDEVTAHVNENTRNNIIKNHTATHLLHQALKDVLGDHVNQAGSLVASERLRFDFSHFSAITDEEITKIEQLVNEKIWASIHLTVEHHSLDDAKKLGAMALFGEKYGDIVRVVQIGDYSIELCGGCHVNNTAEIGLFKIIAESGIGAGTRRIEAMTSAAAYRFMNDQLTLLENTAELARTKPNQLPSRVEDLISTIRGLERENESLSAQLANIAAADMLDEIDKVNGVSLLAKQVSVKDMGQLRNMVDDLKEQITSGIVVLGAEQSGKVILSAGVTKDLVEHGFHAGQLVGKVAKACGGGGGGRPDMAQAGGSQPENLETALQLAKQYIENKS